MKSNTLSISDMVAHLHNGGATLRNDNDGSAENLMSYITIRAYGVAPIIGVGYFLCGIDSARYTIKRDTNRIVIGLTQAESNAAGFSKNLSGNVVYDLEKEADLLREPSMETTEIINEAAEKWIEDHGVFADCRDAFKDGSKILLPEIERYKTALQNIVSMIGGQTLLDARTLATEALFPRTNTYNDGR